MSQKQKAVIGFLIIALVGFIFYLSPTGQEFFSRGKISLPGPLESAKKREVEEVLSDSEIIKITNEYRNDENLKSLEENKFLNEAAMQRIDDMFEKQYFAHVSPDGSDISDTMKVVGYKYVIVGENLALGYFKDSRDLVDAWMASPGHRENILNSSYTEIGVAHKMGMFKGKKQYLAVQVFAKPLSECPSVDKSLKNEIDTTKEEIDSLTAKLNALEKEIDQLEKETKAYPKRVTQEQAKELKNLYNQLNAKIDEYNSLVSQIQTKQRILNNLIKTYNNQINAFNDCAK